MEDIKSVLGKNIRTLRKQAGWTQEFLAEKTGISVPFMTQIELARKSASLEVVEAIAEALGVSYESLFNSNLSETKEIKYNIHLLEKEVLSTVSKKIHECFQKMDKK